MRKLTGATTPMLPAASFSASSSCSDSTLNIRMPERNAYSISSRVLPTPENTTLRGSAPALSARNSSPPDTMSNPEPSFTKARSTARLELALTEKHTRWRVPAKASSKARKASRNRARLYTYTGVPTAATTSRTGTSSQYISSFLCVNRSTAVAIRC